MPRDLVTFEKRSEEEDSDDWALSYSDMVTLMLCFFVILLAVSTIDPIRFQRVAQSMAGAVGTGTDEPSVSLEELYEEVMEIIEERGLEEDVQASITRIGVAVNFRGHVLFALGKADLLDTAKPILQKIAEEIKKMPYDVLVEGHTDDQPIASAIFPSNWELSTARACRVVRFLTHSGVPSDRLKAAGLADTQPEAPNTTPEGVPIPENQARNRRVVVIFLAV